MKIDINVLLTLKSRFEKMVSEMRAIETSSTNASRAMLSSHDIILDMVSSDNLLVKLDKLEKADRVYKQALEKGSLAVDQWNNRYTQTQKDFSIVGDIKFLADIGFIIGKAIDRVPVYTEIEAKELYKEILTLRDEYINLSSSACKQITAMRGTSKAIENLIKLKIIKKSLDAVI